MRLDFCLTAVLCAAVSMAQVSPSPSHSKKLHLKVTLMDPRTTSSIEADIFEHNPFEHSEMRNGTKITIKGNLVKTGNANYHMQLLIAEWTSATSNSAENYEMDLTPGKPRGGGVVSGVALQRSVLISRVASSR
jgi:RecG-like helicase